MAAEMFRVGSRDFRLPGLGSYLQTAANAGNLPAVLWGVVALVLVIVFLDQFVWRPLLAWADKFKVEMVEGDEPPTSWFLNVLARAWLAEQFGMRVWQPFSEWIDSTVQSGTAVYPVTPLTGARLDMILARAGADLPLVISREMSQALDP